MRGIFRALVIAVLFAIGAMVAGLYSSIQYRIADADKAFAMFDFSRADSVYEEVARKVPPWIWLSREAAFRRREVWYWQGAYGVLVGDSAFFAQDTLNSRGYVLHADAWYRSARNETERNGILAMYERAIDRYKASFAGGFDPDAAYNIEYLLRVKQEVARRKPEKQQGQKGQKAGAQPQGNNPGGDPGEENQYGAQGKPAPGTVMPKVRTFVPVPPEGDRERNDAKPAGKGTYKKKKG